MSEEGSSEDYSHDTPYVVVACIIFATMSFTFLFPCNRLIPLDRRTIGVVCALACYLTRAFIFPSKRMDLLSAIDFDVLLLLASIMIVNHIVVHLKETKRIISYFQSLVRDTPLTGFWAISLVSFGISPFLTNDGVCLLFVEPILTAFEDVKDEGVVAAAGLGVAAGLTASSKKDAERGPASPKVQNSGIELQRTDALYFLLALACSTNIGSALTYTGNPQNMIVASDAIEAMPSYKFLIYMLAPSLTTWYVTIKWVERCWMQNRAALNLSGSINSSEEQNNPLRPIAGATNANGKQLAPLSSCECAGDGSGPASPPPLSPRRRLAREREKLVKRVVKVVFSPAPYVVLILLALMIIMIFVDVMPISALICVAAISMVLCVVLGNYWQNSMIWEESEEEQNTQNAQRASQRSNRRSTSASFRRSSSKNSIELQPTGTHQRSHSQSSTNGNAIYFPAPQSADVVNYTSSAELGPPTREDRIDNLNQFFDDLFDSIDYSLLLIFLGTFVVVENMASTGIPKNIWKGIVGDVPFATASSVIGISIFILVASQFLGNVAVIQLAKPNVEDLEDDAKRLAWSVISFVATIGGNLTITGSAANIIVAEKANRMDATIGMDFFRHYRVCFWITLFCCMVSGTMLALIVSADNATGSNW